MNKVYLSIIAFIWAGCANTVEKTEYERLLEFEGRYEYIDDNTLDIVASAPDSTLYAVIDEAKYPLRSIKGDSFANIQNVPVVFERNDFGEIAGYNVNDQTFKLLSRDFERMEMNPRRQLDNDPKKYQYAQPQKLEDGLAVGNLADAFENPEPILEMVRRTIGGEYKEIHSILIFKNNKLVLEEYFYGYHTDRPHQLRSASKPFIGGILGIAVDKGFIKSEKAKLLPYFYSQYPEIANLDDLKKRITIEDFLRYRHGMDCENDNPNSKGNEQSMMQSEDWVKHTLDLPMKQKAGEISSYCTGCALTIGSLVERASNQEIEAFAREHLFGPLGIDSVKWTFEPNPASLSTFSQMYLSSRDLIKLAKMYQDKGVWKDKQILSEDWVKKTFTMEKGDYGFFWKHRYYVVEGKEYNSYLATGNGGQKISIWPELDMITVFTGGNYNYYAIHGKSTPPNEMIPKYILKAVE